MGRHSESSGRREPEMRRRERSSSRQPPYYRSRSPSRRAVRSHSREITRGPTTRYEDRLMRLETMIEHLVESSISDSASQPPPRYLVDPECIPEFQPGNDHLTSEMWVAKLDELATINDWDERIIIRHMQSRLGGLAKTWYNGLNNYNLTWREWRELILKTFPSHQDYASKLRKLLSRTKMYSESWDTYYFDKMQLVTACDISGQKAVSCIIDGITDKAVKTSAYAGRYPDPETLYSDYLSTLSSYFVDTSPSDPGPSKSKYRLQLRKADHPYKRSGSAKKSKCFNCHQLGHLHKECPLPRKECLNCLRIGHDTAECKSSRPNDMNPWGNTTVA